MTSVTIGPVSARRPDLGRCLLWGGSTTKKGYGTLHVGPSSTTAHRWRWARHHKLEPKQHVDHLCKVRNCIRTRHLEAVTPRVNLERSDNLAFARVHDTHCARGHAYTPNNTAIRGNNTRRCKTCAIEARARREVAA